MYACCLQAMQSLGSSSLQQEFSAMEATLELLYWSQNEIEYHRQLQEYYTLRAQHQQEQQRLNQVLYGHCLPHELGLFGQQQKYGRHQQQQQVAQLGQQLEQGHNNDVMMAGASPARAPLQPLAQANQKQHQCWQQQQQQHKAADMDTCCTQLAGRKRTSETGELLSTGQYAGHTVCPCFASHTASSLRCTSALNSWTVHGRGSLECPILYLREGDLSNNRGRRRLSLCS